jgi:hypothetical protein
MNQDTGQSVTAAKEPAYRASSIAIPQLVGEVYDSAPAGERAHLLEALLRPLGVLSLLAVANGVFANIRFRSGWRDFHVHLEDIQNVQGSDVAALVDFAQQTGIEAIDGLTQMLAASPVLASSAAAGLLFTVLMRRARSRRRSAIGFHGATVYSSPQARPNEGSPDAVRRQPL